MESIKTETDDALRQAAEQCLSDIMNQTLDVGQLIHKFIVSKMHVHLGQKDTPAGIRKCLREKLNDPCLYSTICRWIQASLIEIKLKLPHDVWSLTVLLQFNRFHHDDWANILAVFSEQQAPSMSEMKLRCEELLADGVISLKKPRQNQNVEKTYQNLRQKLREIEPEKLMDLMSEIESILDQKTQPQTEKMEK
ncbi:MAG: hypothetical protein CL578_02000 [Alteromonadaceae bacterium]|jgi:hypothetical protein|uniref:Uncharacterized protein n=1 Tax=Paraglaciecola agarilytica NO2 TaxID=1125747 RepID=A0ABQ0IEZ9_9ALTE|nr:hypothetical protein [Paraglaciecola agarilytica]MBN23805.1 hypothetical protein [Alteromonadaceae bacterium]GAC07832.1 hypothetical protein GAGA_5009 [Paraglaciecola agarilytica NO2]|tara:strand:+ start:27426 stop:28007 length:582 start_codon:yes stop_codon:yes gene_type:complete